MASRTPSLHQCITSRRESALKQRGGLPGGDVPGKGADSGHVVGGAAKEALGHEEVRDLLNASCSRQVLLVGQNEHRLPLQLRVLAHALCAR